MDGGQAPLDVPVFVVTHNVPDGWDDAPFTFVTDGVESAVAQAAAVAGSGIVGVSGGDVVQQCLNAGLIDEIAIDLVPVLLGGRHPLLRLPHPDAYRTRRPLNRPWEGCHAHVFPAEGWLGEGTH
jgi:dihydrofolate reductase